MQCIATPRISEVGVNYSSLFRHMAARWSGLVCQTSYIWHSRPWTATLPPFVSHSTVNQLDWCCTPYIPPQAALEVSLSQSLQEGFCYSSIERQGFSIKDSWKNDRLINLQITSLCLSYFQPRAWASYAGSVTPQSRRPCLNLHRGMFDLSKSPWLFF